MWYIAAFIFLALSYWLSWRFRGSRSKGYYEKGVYKILVEVTGKHVSGFLFQIRCRVEAWNFIKQRAWYRCSPTSFNKFLRRPFHKHLGTAAVKEQYLLLDSLFAMFQLLLQTNRHLFFHEETAPYFFSKILVSLLKLFFENTPENKDLPNSNNKTYTKNASVNVIKLSL